MVEANAANLTGARTRWRRRLVSGWAIAVAVLALSWWTLGRVHLRNGIRDLNRHDFDSAQHHFESFVQLNPWSNDERLLAAQAARRAGRIDAAQQHLEAVQATRGVNDESAFEWALLRAQRGEPVAFESFLNASGHDRAARTALTREAIAVGALKKDQLPLALESLDLLLKGDPSHFQGRVLRARLWIRLNRWDDARVDAQMAHEVRPDSRDAAVVFGQVLHHLGFVADAARQFDGVLRRDPRDVDALLGLARCRIDSRQRAEAGELLACVLVVQPGNADASFEMGRIHLREGKPDDAIEALRRAALSRPTDREVLELLRLAYESVGKVDDAQRIDARLRQLESLTKPRSTNSRESP